jgi:HlyD family secretion protein
MKHKKLILAFGAGALLLGWSLWRPGRIEAGPATAAVQEIDRTLVVAPGRVEAVSENIEIGTQLDGRLQNVPVEEGQHVKKGQVLAVLDNADFVARVRLAEAAIQEREAEMLRLRNGSRAEARLEAAAQVREAEVVLDHAKLERERRRKILERGAISQTEFDVMDREYRAAEARVEMLRQRLALIRDETRQEDVMRVEAEIARAKAQKAEAESMLAKTVIRSPIDGTVLRRHKQRGESVSTSLNNPILVVGDTSRLRVRVDVDETDVAKIALGQRAVIRAAAFGEREFSGRVVKIGSILGRKNVMTDEPTERVDRKVLETLVELDAGQQAPLGLRVDTYIQTR